jgi:hypothetical protein
MAEASRPFRVIICTCDRLDCDNCRRRMARAYAIESQGRRGAVVGDTERPHPRVGPVPLDAAGARDRDDLLDESDTRP